MKVTAGAGSTGHKKDGERFYQSVSRLFCIESAAPARAIRPDCALRARVLL